MKPTIYLLSGLPASGKSTRALAWVAEDPDGRIRVNYDDARLARYGPDWKFNRRDEDAMKAASEQTVRDAINAGLSVVIDNTNLTKGARDKWARMAIALGATYIEEEVDTSVEECIRRDSLRTGKARVGRTVIERMALFNGFTTFETVGNPIVVVDIDGTIADCEHRIHHIKPQDGSKKNWAAFHDPTLVAQDRPIEPIINLVGALYHYGYDVVFITGRDTSLGIVTEEWLNEYVGTDYKHLFMRASGDSRKDFEHKLEILSYIPKDRVKLILEDRDQMVQALRDAGYTCLQVTNGSY